MRAPTGVTAFSIEQRAVLGAVARPPSRTHAPRPGAMRPRAAEGPGAARCLDLRVIVSRFLWLVDPEA